MGKRVIEIKAKNGTVYLYEDESYWDRERVFEAQTERIRRDIVTGKEVETSMVQRAIDQAQAKGDAGLLTGLSGLGLSLICLSDKSHLTWLGLI